MSDFNFLTIQLIIFSTLFLASCTVISFAKEKVIPESIKKELIKLNLIERAEYTGTYSNNGKFYAIHEAIKLGKGGFIVRIWNIASGELKYSIKSQIPELSNLVSLTFNKDDNILAFEGMFGSVLLWYFKENRLVKSCFDAMGSSVEAFSKDNKIMYITTTDGHHKLCSTTSNYVYLTTKNIDSAVLINNKLLTIYATRFTPYKIGDPYGFSWRTQDSNCASPEVMKSYLEIWELNKSKEKGFKRETLLDSTNGNYMIVEFHSTETILEQWNYKTRKLNYRKKLAPLSLNDKYDATIKMNSSHNRLLISGSFEQMLIDSKTGKVLIQQKKPQ